MKALIFEQPGAIGAGGLDIAGQPLLVRQLQWLRDNDITEVVVEVCAGPGAEQRGALLLGSDPLTAQCVVIPVRAPVGVDELAARAGLAAEELFLALPADCVVSGPWSAPTGPLAVQFPPPPFAPRARVRTIACHTRATPAPGPSPAEQGWALAIGDLGAAHALSCAALAGQVPELLVHAAELRPGVWLARGARVAEDAVLSPPVLIGRGAHVLSAAQLGPNVIVGDGAIIERHVLLQEASVQPDTLIGEGARIRDAHVDARGITSFADHARIEVDDPLQLTHVRARGAPLAARAFALCLVWVLGLPWLLGATWALMRGRSPWHTLPWRGRALHQGMLGSTWLDVVPALYDVLLGRRDLLGLASSAALELGATRNELPARAGALDVGAVLAPGASRSTLVGMWRWYMLNKGPSLDRALIGPALRQLLSSEPRND